MLLGIVQLDAHERAIIMVVAVAESYNNTCDHSAVANVWLESSGHAMAIYGGNIIRNRP